MSGKDADGNVGGGGEFAKEATTWQPPNSRDADKWNNRPPGSGQTNNWATPDANTATRSNGLMGPNIREQAANWTTPQAHDVHPGDASRVGRFGSKAWGANLTDDVAKWSADK